MCVCVRVGGLGLTGKESGQKMQQPSRARQPEVSVSRELTRLSDRRERRLAAQRCEPSRRLAASGRQARKGRAALERERGSSDVGGFR